MTDETVQPAMTAEEWTYLLAPTDHHGTHGPLNLDSTRDCEVCLGGETPHAKAAICLHDQPFGFTQEDVKLLRFAATMVEYELGHGKPTQEEDALRSLANRIAALLPPA